MWSGFLAEVALINMFLKPGVRSNQGMTLIELIIVVAIMGILLTMAVPNYLSYMLRVHRTEAIRMLLQASMCQERLNAISGRNNTGLCHQASEQHRYEIRYDPPNTLGRTFVATAVPQGAQLADPCGSLSVDQNGARIISSMNLSALKWWNGR